MSWILTMDFLRVLGFLSLPPSLGAGSASGAHHTPASKIDHPTVDINRVEKQVAPPQMKSYIKYCLEVQVFPQKNG